jgi:hypothetical protein
VGVVSLRPCASDHQVRVGVLEDQAAANLHLLLQLGELTGRLEPSSIGGYSQRGEPAGWMRLRDVDEAAIERVLTRIRRRYPEHRLHGGNATDVVGQLDVHFCTAQERRRREPV